MDELKKTEIETKSIHKRLTKKIADEKDFAISKFAKDSLEILDNFERCFENFHKKEEEIDLKDS